MRNSILVISSKLSILLFLIFLSIPSLAYPYEKIINFDSGVSSGVEIKNPQNCSYVPTTLPSGTGNALRCNQGGSLPMYVGLAISPITPLTNNVYVRYYVRFMPGWTFGFGSSQLKAIIWNGTHRNFTTVETNGGVGTLMWEDDQCPQYGGPSGRCLSTGRVAADGQWRLVEARSYKNGANGRFTIWLDGVQVMDYAVDIGAASEATTYIEIGYQNTPSGGYSASRYIEYEDVVIADHYVGPNGATSPSPPASPAPPVNLRVQ
ncbi:MAG: hypothetical protein E4G97_00035 [Deltaproteobacteria bacterium]|nr:MAG: hypothetical protein E4G97_00035 [Deltaproteobacteria bacterium]